MIDPNILPNYKVSLFHQANLAYNYFNDCLKAGLVYRREYYTDRDIETSDTLMFNITLFPFGKVSLPSVDR